MKHILDELEEMSLTTQHGNRLDSSELFFDDEALDDILYGAGQGKGPTLANLFRRGQSFVDKIVAAYRAGNSEDLICAAHSLGNSGEELSIDMSRTLVEVMCQFVPTCPYPVMKYNKEFISKEATPSPQSSPSRGEDGLKSPLSRVKNASNSSPPLRGGDEGEVDLFDVTHGLNSNMLLLGPLLRKLWQDALLMDEKDLMKKAGFVLSHWCENHGLYQKSREVLGRLKLLYRELVDRPEEAGTVNGLGFTYLLEEKWKEAVPYFEEAASEFNKMHQTFRYANARCNYWTCRFELGDMGDLDETEKELKELSAILNGEGRWHERKPLILRAKLEEKKGNIDKAIILAMQAIKVTQKGETRYPEFDGEYLEQLRRVRNSSQDIATVEIKPNQETVV